jgi:hypothetical protein
MPIAVLPLTTYYEVERRLFRWAGRLPSGWRRFRIVSRVLKFAMAASTLSIVSGGALLVTSPLPTGALPSPEGSGCTRTTVPTITSVSPVVAEQTQTITITGTCFGSGNTSTSSDTRFFQITDKTASPIWNACHTVHHDLVTCTVTEWTKTEIVFSGFTGSYGANNWSLQPGDKLKFGVWNLHDTNVQTFKNAGTKTVIVSSGSD